MVSRQYSQRGAISILYELDWIKVKTPSVSTINRILKKHDLVRDNKTPNELLRKIKYFSRLEKTIDLSERPYIDEGQLIFIRFIRSNLTNTILNSSFKVQEKLIYSYVEAIIQIEKHLLITKHKEVVYHYFEFIMPMS